MWDGAGLEGLGNLHNATRGGMGGSLCGSTWNGPASARAAWDRARISVGGNVPPGGGRVARSTLPPPTTPPQQPITLRGCRIAAVARSPPTFPELPHSSAATADAEPPMSETRGLCGAHAAPGRRKIGDLEVWAARSPALYSTGNLLIPLGRVREPPAPVAERGRRDAALAAHLGNAYVRREELDHYVHPLLGGPLLTRQDFSAFPAPPGLLTLPFRSFSLYRCLANALQIQLKPRAAVGIVMQGVQVGLDKFAQVRSILLDAFLQSLWHNLVMWNVYSLHPLASIPPPALPSYPPCSPQCPSSSQRRLECPVSLPRSM